MSIYSFPGLEISFSVALPPLSVVIVAGGRPPEAAWLKKTAAGRVVWAVDSGVDTCLDAMIEPGRLIGDCDSARPDSWKAVEARGIPVDLYPREKDLTDLQIALKSLGMEGTRGALVTGCWGGRFDHLFSNVFSLLGARAWGADIRCVGDEKELLLLVRGGESIEVAWVRPPIAISLLALGERCRGVSITGVRWPLERATLTRDLPYAISNEPCGERVQLSLEAGELAVYLGWSEET